MQYGTLIFSVFNFCALAFSTLLSCYSINMLFVYLAISLFVSFVFTLPLHHDHILYSFIRSSFPLYLLL